MPMNPSIAEYRSGRPVLDDDDNVIRESGLYPTMALIGRLLIAALFLMSGIAKLTDLPGTVAHMTKAGIPYADTLAIIAGAAEVLGALALVLGLLTRVGAFGLILYMIPTTVIFHAFWNYESPERMKQMIDFMKNLSIIGGLAVIVGLGAGRYSLDHRIAHRRAHRTWRE